jgi:eukaryotic-like serine/threonine-protein kinase
MADTSTLGPSSAPQSGAPATATLEKGSPAGGPPEAAPPLLPRGFTIGRYVVLERIGLGGMGAVYAAYDPELDRRVALKVLRRTAVPEPGEAGGEQVGAAGERLLAEARALARLQHPNVLRVYDVGSDRGQVFVTTELLVGLDLGSWAYREKRDWQQLVDAFLAIGAGLAAAHAEGLVHCDVKPGNMMVCDDGRILLVDFGIAADTGGGEGPVLDSGVLELTVGRRRRGGPTPSGAGTPGFMAPEQARGGPVGPAADIYSFSLSLWRILYGRAPAPASSPSSSGVAAAPEREASATGIARPEMPPPLPKSVSWRLRALLEKGLREDPAERPARLEDLLEGLRQIRGLRRRRLLLAAGLLLPLLLLLLGRTLWAPPADCFEGGKRFAAVWNAARREALAGRFASAPSGVELFAATRAAIETYGAGWRSQGEAWCREGRRGASSDLLRDLRAACLDQRLRELDASLALAGSRSEIEPPKIAEMFAGLVPVAACADTRALLAPATPALDPGQQAELEDLRRGQAGLRALWTGGVMREGRELAASLLPRARALGHLPVEAELLYSLGLFEDGLVDAAAGDTLRQAALTAGASRHDRTNAEALIRLVRVEGLGQKRLAEARRAATLARAALGNLSRPALLAADLADFEGLIARQEGDYKRALELHRTALLARRQELGAGHPELAFSHLRLGILLDDQDRQDEAREQLEKALAIQLAAYGEAHPSIAETYTRLGTVAREQGRLEEAREFHEKALALRLRVLGEGRPLVAESRTYLGELAALRGDLPLARRELAAAKEILVRELGPDHYRLGVLLATEASALTEAGFDREAVAPYRRALEIFEKSFGPGHPQVGVLSYNLGAVQLRLADYPAALLSYQRAAAIFEKSVGPDSSLFISAQSGKGETLERLGRDAEARPLLEAALAADARHTAQGEEFRGAKFRADTSFALARLLLRMNGKPDVARRLALAAGELYRQDEKASQRELAELESWLTSNR